MLYYVDTSSHPLIKEFIPRIPENRMFDEDEETERICLAKTIEGCFSASSELEDLYSRHTLCPNEVFRLYIFDENEIEEGNLTDSYELWKNKLVPDANITGEVWIENQSLIPKEVKYISIHSLDYKRAVQPSFDEWVEYEDKFQISQNFQDVKDITLDKFAELTGERAIATKAVYFNVEIEFYEENELLFSQIYERKEHFMFKDYKNTETIISLSEYFPNIDDFSRFNNETTIKKMTKFIFDDFYHFSEKGIQFTYKSAIIRKEGFLDLFKEN